MSNCRVRFHALLAIATEDRRRMFICVPRALFCRRQNQWRMAGSLTSYMASAIRSQNHGA